MGHSDAQEKEETHIVGNMKYFLCKSPQVLQYKMEVSHPEGVVMGEEPMLGSGCVQIT